MSDGADLHVHSIFHTIQGEGPFAGRASTFIRLWGCHLKCFFCDTDFESEVRVIGVRELVQSVERRLVVLTGGEPMRQNIVPLCTALVRAGHVVQVETAGSFWWHHLPEEVSLVVSPKLTSVHEEVGRRAQAWKYIISSNSQLSPVDGLPLSSTQDLGREAHLARPPPELLIHEPHRVLVQPMDEGEAERTEENLEACVRLAHQYGYTVSLQQHKIIGVP